MERCIDKSERQCLKWRKSCQQDYASINVVRCHWLRQKNFPKSPMLGGGKKLFEIQNYSYRSDRVVLNETSLHDSTTSDLPLDSPMNHDSPIQQESRPIGRKVPKTKRGSNSTNDTTKVLEQIALNGTMRIERDMKRDANEKVMYKEFTRERKYARKQDMENKDRETIAMDMSHISPK
ncbi:unnamed protein product [Prunus armeniaca]